MGVAASCHCHADAGCSCWSGTVALFMLVSHNNTVTTATNCHGRFDGDQQATVDLEQDSYCKPNSPIGLLLLSSTMVLETRRQCRTHPARTTLISHNLTVLFQDVLLQDEAIQGLWAHRVSTLPVQSNAHRQQ